MLIHQNSSLLPSQLSRSAQTSLQLQPRYGNENNSYELLIFNWVHPWYCLTLHFNTAIHLWNYSVILQNTSLLPSQLSWSAQMLTEVSAKLCNQEWFIWTDLRRTVSTCYVMLQHIGCWRKANCELIYSTSTNVGWRINEVNFSQEIICFMIINFDQGKTAIKYYRFHGMSTLLVSTWWVVIHFCHYSSSPKLWTTSIFVGKNTIVVLNIKYHQFCTQ